MGQLRVGQSRVGQSREVQSRVTCKTAGFQGKRFLLLLLLREFDSVSVFLNMNYCLGSRGRVPYSNLFISLSDNHKELPDDQ